MKKKITSLVMAAAMMTAMLSPAAVFAEDPEAVSITDDSGNGNEQVPADEEETLISSDDFADENEQAGSENADDPEAVICSNDPADGNEQAGSEETDRLSQYVNGYIPVSDTYYVGGKKMIRAAAFQESSGLLLSGSEDEDFPEAYRSDEQPWAAGISVRDQKRTATCWAFGTLTASEYSYAKEVYDQTGEVITSSELSPGHLAQFLYNRVDDPLGNTYGDSNTKVDGLWMYDGHELFAMQHLATWSGAALEEKYPIDAINDHVISDKNYDYVWDGTGVVFPSAAAYDDVLVQQESVMIYHPVKNTMKGLVLKYGALVVGMEFDLTKYMNPDETDPETGEPYLDGRSFYNYNQSCTANHTVTLVGWDDDYPKENFTHVIQEMVDAAEAEARAGAETKARDRAEAEAKELYKDKEGKEKRKLIREYVEQHLDTYIEEIVAAAVEKAEEDSRKKTTPDQNGAWIIQNSWGADAHDHGFLYVSYESVDFNTSEITQMFAFDMQPADTYRYNFQYDGTAGYLSSGDRYSDGRHLDFYTRPGSRAANVFTNTTGEPVSLEAVGFTNHTVGSQEYDVSVYTGLADQNDPASGTCQGTTKVTTETPGCKTAVLDRPVCIAPGETYSIVFDFTDYANFGFETEFNNGGWLHFEAQIDPGQSFFSRSGSGKWVDMAEYGACFRIKGFANPCTYDLTGANVVLSNTKYTFNNKTQKPEILTIAGVKLTEGTDYTAKWSDVGSKNAGSYSVTIKGKGNFTGQTKASYKIVKAANPMTVKGKTASVSYKALSENDQTLAASKVLKISNNQGKATCKKVSGNAKILIASNGKVTVKKGLKKNTYTVKVKVTAAGNANYKPVSKTVSIRITVK